LGNKLLDCNFSPQPRAVQEESGKNIGSVLFVGVFNSDICTCAPEPTGFDTPCDVFITRRGFIDNGGPL